MLRSVWPSLHVSRIVHQFNSELKTVFLYLISFQNALLLERLIFTNASKKYIILSVILFKSAVQRSTFCQFPFQWIYYCHSSKSTGKEIFKTHLCALYCCRLKHIEMNKYSPRSVVVRQYVRTPERNQMVLT